MHILIPALHRPVKPTGVCRHAANLAQCLATVNKITKVTLVIGAWQKSYFEQSFSFVDDKINLVTVDIKNSSISRNIWFLFGLPQLASNLHPDLIHLSFPIPFRRSLFSVPVVTTIHDLYPYEYPQNFGYPQVIFNRLFLKQCLNNSDGLACVSKCTLESLQYYFTDICLSKENEVIYNFVDFSQVAPKIPKAIDINNQNFFLTVAQHRHNKNLVLLIRAYHLLVSQNKLPDGTKLIIVGSKGPETAAIYHEIEQFSLQEKVILLSSIEDSELCWLYQNCELFVAPSSTEGFCLPLAEAIYLSCRVVCSDISIFREIGDSNVTYFNLKDNICQNLAVAILDSLSKPHSDNNESSFRFSKPQAALNYSQFYAKILE